MAIVRGMALSALRKVLINIIKNVFEKHTFTLQSILNFYIMNCVVLGQIENAGMDCLSSCNSRQGACEWCGSMGFCCTKKNGWNDTSNGCDGTFGGETQHECVLKPIGMFNNF